MSTMLARQAASLGQAVDDDVLVKKAVRAAGRKLGLSLKDIAVITGTRREIFSRPQESLSAKQMELCLLIIRVARSLSALMGGDERHMRHWIETENRSLGGVPRQQMGSVEGLVRSVHYLDAMRGKL